MPTRAGRPKPQLGAAKLNVCMDVCVYVYMDVYLHLHWEAAQDASKSHSRYSLDFRLAQHIFASNLTSLSSRARGAPENAGSKCHKRP